MFADRCSQEFDRDARSRGEKYSRAGRVQFDLPRKSSVRATVDDFSDYHEVFLDWSNVSDGFVESMCTCTHFEKFGPCEHVWAAMLAADARGMGPRSGSRKLEVLDAEPSDRWDDVEEDEPDDDDPWLGRSAPSRRRTSRGFSPLATSSRSRGTTGWRNRLSGVFQTRPSDAEREVLSPLSKNREVWYLLDVESSRSADNMIIQFFQREAGKNGEAGKLDALSVREDQIDGFTHPEDRRMLRLLLASDEDREPYDDFYGYGRNRYGYEPYRYEPGTSEVLLPRGAYESVLPRLCATGRFVDLPDSGDPEADLEHVGRVLNWDDGPPWRFRLLIEPDDRKKRWRLQGQLVREGSDPVALDAPRLLLPGGVVLLEDRLARLDADDFLEWIDALRTGPAVEIPYKDRWELLKSLWQLPVQPELALPPNLRCQEVRVPPQGSLKVHSPNKSYGVNRLYGDVEFLYDGKAVRARDRSAGVFDPETERLLVRDLEKEREMLRLLADRGLRPADPSGREHDVWIPHQRFAELVSSLVQAGWAVEAEGHLIRKPGQFRLNVVSGIDWFDLEGTFDFEGAEASLPDLLAALRRGEKYVPLGDGSRGLLPQEWLNRFAAMANLGTAEGDHVRFRTSQALLLDALLAARENVSIDRRFAEVRRKLRTFQGVAPRTEPRGFQGQLREYQKEGLGWLYFLRDFRLGGCLADDMGLGKTVQVLALLQSRRMRPKDADGRRAPSLVVVPRSLVFNWLDEARRFTPNLRVLDYTGTQREDALERADEYDLLVTTYGTLLRDIVRLKEIRFDYAILDEAQAIKNAQSQRAKACRLLQADHRLAMTGTPVENHLGELWSLFEFLNPGMLGTSSAFQRISKAASAGSEELALLRRALAPFILRRTKEQVLADLPDKTEQTLYCDLEGKQRKRYDQLRDYYRATLSERIQKSGLAKAKIHVLEALLRLRQAACHPGLIDKGRLDEPSPKLDSLMEQLKEVIDEGHKALVFSQFTSFLSIVRRRLDAQAIPYEYLDGRTRDRQQRVHRFQNDPDCRLFLISLKAGGQGLNLTAADYVFILDPWWNPAVEAQAVDRTHRIGQDRHVFAYRLIARDTVEEKVLELQKTKRDLAEAIVSADSNVLRTLTAEDLEMLLA